jgi:hypothetical protein
MENVRLPEGYYRIERLQWLSDILNRMEYVSNKSTNQVHQFLKFIT